MAKTTFYMSLSRNSSLKRVCGSLLFLLVSLQSTCSALSSVSRPRRSTRRAVSKFSALDMASTDSTSTSGSAGCPTRKIVDRSTLTLLEHVNLNVPNHDYILPFYFHLLGCGMDPRKAANLRPDAPKKTLWANCGASQFHLPYGTIAQHIPGHIGLRYDCLKGLETRLNDESGEGCFDLMEKGTDPRTGRAFIKLVDCYKNVFYCRVGDPVNTDKRQPIISIDQTAEWSDVATTYGLDESDCRGIDYIEFLCPKGTAQKIATFYESVLDATTTVLTLPTDGLSIAIIGIGDIDETGKADQSILFRETTGSIPEYDGHHIAMYVGESMADFEQAYRNANLADIVWCNPRFSDQADTLEKARIEQQFRFKDIVDMETGERIFELEHEMRSIHHSAWPGPKPSVN